MKFKNICIVFYSMFSILLLRLLNFHFISSSHINFVNENHLYDSDIHLYYNFTNFATITDLYSIRKKSKYRKIGYKGHPQNYIFSYPLDEKILISPLLNSNLIYLLIFVHCRPDEFYERMLHRKLIKRNMSEYHVVYITSKSNDNLINSKLKYESNLYKDILQFNEISSYFNLSIQTIHMLEWSENINYKFILKTDIDVYINIPFIITFLIDFNLTNTHYAIGRKSKAYVIRDKKYSHYVPYNIVNESLYPSYLQGVGYIIPLNTVKMLCRNIEYVNPKLWIEDVFMGYLYKYTNVTLIDISSYIIREVYHNISIIIQNINKFMLIHGFYPIEIYLLHNHSANQLKH